MNNFVDLTVDKVIKGGLGLGRLADGQVVMIPRVLPGELVRVLPRKKRNRYLEADLLQVLKPSTQRVSPGCPAYEACGGCALQHAAYPEQLRLKQAILSETLCRSGLCREEELGVLLGEPVASPQPFAYRQRIRLQVQDGVLGFFSHRSHSLIPVSSCPLAEEAINAVLAALLTDERFQSLLTLASAIELLASPARSSVILLIHYPRKTRAAEHLAARQICQTLPGLMAVIFIVAGQAKGPCFTDRGEGDLRELRVEFSLPADLCGRPLEFSLEPGGFCQVNLAQNENCIRLLLAWTKEMPPGKALDLFCGMGNFSLPLAMSGWEITGMDMQRSTIRSAQRNAETAGLGERCRFSQESAVKAVNRLLLEKTVFDCLILDPPRSGCAELIPLLSGFKAREIIYIACDPATLARDLAGLSKHGYRIIEVRMVDMFPQTGEQESMVRLRAGL